MILAIDPDVTKSGVAIIDGNELTILNLSFCEVVYNLLPSYHNKDVKVIIEAGYVIGSNWHTHNRNKQQSIEIARRTGENHQVAKLLVEICRFLKLSYIAQRPLVKCWTGKDRKITHEEIVQVLNNAGIAAPTRTNQETRDAILLALYHTKKPIKINIK